MRVCHLDELPAGEAVKVGDGAAAVAVFNVDGELYATSDTCTHGQSSLSDGYIDGPEVECAWHFAKFCLRTGKALTLPASQPLETYQVKVEGGEVFVDL